jgi:hypothetical protein
VVHVANDAVRIEQHDEMLGEIGEGVDFQFVLAEPYRTGLGDAEGGTDDTDVERAAALPRRHISDGPRSSQEC